MNWFDLVALADNYAGQYSSKPCLVFSRTETVRHDDRPSDSNSGLCAAGITHLETRGYKEHDKVRVLLIIEKVTHTPEPKPGDA